MCGIAGAWAPHPEDAGVLHALGAAMGAAIAHRGPDDAGTWTDPGAGLVLAHRRLSIIDPGPSAHQPMASVDGRWRVSYNGEVYNHAALRAELSALGHAFRGRSDTEVLVASIAQWGVRDALARSNGMFAFAAWDTHAGELWLARDRVGKKPLYYGWSGDGSFVFGSELAALRAHPALATSVDPDALALLLRFDYIPAPHAILRGVHKLGAGRLLRLDAAHVAGGAHGHDPSRDQQAWWNARERQEAMIDRGFDGDEAAALDALDALLRDATALRMKADVPLGSFLSGGIDSSLVTALMQAQSPRAVRSFSIGFDDAGHDESAHAAAVARHLGTDHTELRIDSRAVLDLLPSMPRVFDEPFADCSQLPTALLCQLTRRHVTVALSGDGGDELFFGYSRYARALRNHRMASCIPAPLRALLGREHGEGARLGGVAALRAALAADGVQAIARQRMQRWRNPEAVVLGARRRATVYDDPSALPRNGTVADALMALDFAGFLPEGVLTKVDRASMAVSLEARAPLLDWRVAEFAWSLPLAMKWKGGRLKHLPKRLLERYVPRALVDRPKAGFGAPVGAWLRGPLRDWGEALLDERRLREEGHFDPVPIRAIWREFQAGRRKWHTHLWGVLMFQAWREGFADGRAPYDSAMHGNHEPRCRHLP